jgi:phosphate/sulfate permease
LFYNTNNYTTKGDVSANIRSITVLNLFTFADCLYSIIISLTANYINSRQSVNKYIGIIVLLIIYIILLGGCIALFFINRLIKSLKLRKKIKQNYENLKKDQKKT